MPGDRSLKRRCADIIGLLVVYWSFMLLLLLLLLLLYGKLWGEVGLAEREIDRQR